ncbi:hypothetical protein Rhal01_01178 [Rubritalea halochordaticola]|uniref:Core-binding (CB) domain-containing protein n=1 Tax=Rubritalea halochordaticola TaxID=714537 RepID=A0ABP9UZ88_9BACT
MGVIHKLPSLKPYKHPSCNWRVSYTALVGNKVKRVAKAFKEKSEAKTFYDLKMSEYKVHNLMSVNELVAVLPALTKWIKFCEQSSGTVSLESLDEVVVSAMSTLEARQRSQRIGLIIESFLEEKKAAHFKKTKQDKDVGSHCRNLKNRLKKLNEYYGEDRLICDITLGEAKGFLSWLYEDYEYGNRTVHNHRSSVVSLFNYALKHEYLDSNVFEKTDTPDEVDQEIHFYSLEDMENIWWRACPDIKLAIVLQAFCGVRTCEYKRMLWSDIDVENQVIYIRGRVGKKGMKRNIQLDPVQAAQIAMLKGKIVPEDDSLDSWLEGDSEAKDESLGDFLDRLENEETSEPCRELPLKVFSLGEREYKRRLDSVVPVRIDNGFRHSFGTYHYALHADWMKTTQMMGNSQKVLAKHYNGLTSRKEAENYFNIINDMDVVGEPIDARYQDEDAPGVAYDEIREVLVEQSVKTHPRERRIHK